MKNILYLFIFIFFIFGCSKKDDSIEEPIEKTYQYEMLEKYDLLKTFEVIDDVQIQDQLNDSLIAFSGILKNKSKTGLIVFNKNSNKKIIDILPFQISQHTFDKPYGEKITVTLDNLGYCNLLQNGNTTVIFLSINSTDQKNKLGYNLMQYLFVKDNKIINSTDIINYSCYKNGLILQWKTNFILTVCEENVYQTRAFLFNPLGEMITNVYNTHYIQTIYQNEILTDEEYVFFNYSEGLGHYISRVNLVGNIKWTTILKTNKLDRPRFDNRKIVSKSDTNFTYELYYTEYNGSKGVIKFKINIETGDIEYI